MLSLMKRGSTLGGKPRFRPGQYLAGIRSAGGSSDLTDEALIFETKANAGELANHHSFRGMQIRFNWTDLEPTQGNYVWTNVHKYKNLLKLSAEDGGTKLLMILLEFKTFDNSYHVVPPYVRTDAYGGGEYRFTGTGYHVRFDNAAVQERLQALITAFGIEFANDDQIEMVSVTETSVPVPVDTSIYTAIGITAFNENILRGMLSVGSMLVAAMPLTIIRMMVNGPRQELQSVDFVAEMVSRGIHAYGAPDTFTSQLSYMTVAYKGLYQNIQEMQGILVIALEVQRRNFYFDNNDMLSKPANEWIADCTVSDNGGFAKLTAATVLHGYSTSVLTDTTGAKTPAKVTLTVAAGGRVLNGFTAGAYEILSVDSDKAITINHAYSGVLTGPPTTMEQAPASGGYPYSGNYTVTLPTQTFVPNANTYQGHTPTIQNLQDISTQQFGSHYIIWSRNTDASVLDGGELNYIRLYKWLATEGAKLGVSCGLHTTRPTSIA